MLSGPVPQPIPEFGDEFHTNNWGHDLLPVMKYIGSLGDMNWGQFIKTDLKPYFDTAPQP